MKGIFKSVTDTIQSGLDGDKKEYGLSDFQKTDWSPAKDAVICIKSITSGRYLRAASSGLPRVDAFQTVNNDTWWTLEFTAPPPLPSVGENDKAKFYQVQLKSVSSGNYLYTAPGSTRVLSNKDTKPSSSWRLRKCFEKNEGEDKKKLAFLFVGWELTIGSSPEETASLCVDSTKQVVLQNLNSRSVSALWDISDATSLAKSDALNINQALIETQTVSVWFKKWVSSGAECKYGDVTFLRPAPNAGFYFLSDYIERGANDVVLKMSEDSNQFLLIDRKDVVCVKDISSAQNLLAPAVDFELVWSSAKCKLDFEVSIWKPIPPTGKAARGATYVALGYVVVTGNKKPTIQDDPNLALFRCVHSSCVVPGAIRYERDGGCIWQDVGTGAKRDLALWKIRKVPVWEEGWGSGAGSGKAVGGFVGVNTYTRPIEPVWCLNDDIIKMQDEEKELLKQQSEKNVRAGNNSADNDANLAKSVSTVGQIGYKLTREAVKWYNTSGNDARLTRAQRTIKKWLLRRRFSEVVRSYRASDKSSTERHRIKVATELYTTEVSYLAFIKQLVDLKRGLMVKYAADPAKFDKIKKLFNNTEEIAAVSDILVKKLAKLNSLSLSDLVKADSYNIGDMFLELVPAFELYRSYYEGYDTSTKIWNDLPTADPALLQDMRDTEKTWESRLDIPSLLIMPIQRPPRYVLLLKDLLKCTPTDHSDWQELTDSLNRLVSVSSHLDEIARKKQFSKATPDALNASKTAAVVKEELGSPGMENEIRLLTLTGKGLGEVSTGKTMIEKDAAQGVKDPERGYNPARYYLHWNSGGKKESGWIIIENKGRNCIELASLRRGGEKRYAQVELRPYARATYVFSNTFKWCLEVVEGNAFHLVVVGLSETGGDAIYNNPKVGGKKTNRLMMMN